MSARNPRWFAALAAAAFIVVVIPAPARAQESAQASLPDSWARSLSWRCIGPANMGGRITALAVYEADPCIWWAATASGGLLKTSNGGVTFEHQFDHEATVAIGDVAVAPSDPAIVWVGTGEANPRNSVSWGDGVYKSTDGGKTWTNMGLRQSFQIGAIAIHPQNPDMVYVGALGRLWGPNEERGLFKTIDGGKTWEKILYVDDKTGVIDVQMHPRDAETLLVATYERQRDGLDSNDPAKKWGPGSGIHKTTDGGKTWTRLTGGLPAGNLGRIGLEYYRANPDIVYALVESERIAKEPENAGYVGLRAEDAEVGARLTEVVAGGPAEAAGLKTGDIVIRVGEATVHSNTDLLAQIRRHMAGDAAEFEVSRERKSVTAQVTFGTRPAAAAEPEQEDEERPRRQQRASRSPFDGGLGGQRENMQDQQGPEGHEYGGLYRSNDGGRTWARINSVNPRPMYFSEVRVDPADDKHVYVLGVALYKSSDGGETFSSDGHVGANGAAHVDHHAMWINPRDGRHIILGNDGGLYVTSDRMGHWDHLNHMAIGQFYHVAVDSRPNYMVYGGLQDNGSWGGPSRSRSNGGPENFDWIRVGGGDGFVCAADPDDPDQVYFESQNGGMGRLNLRTGERSFIRPRAPRGTRYRFNWKTPFVLSASNSDIYYVAGNHVFRSLDKGDGLKAISPEITNTDQGSASALAESPLDADVLYVGTDDGALWMTRNGGHEWTNLFGATPAQGETAAERPAPGADAGPRPEGGARRGGGGPGGRGGRGFPRGERFTAMMREADQNSDGKITREEMPQRMARLFERLDTDGNGEIDAKEIEAGAQQPGEAPAQPAGEAPAPAAPDQPAPVAEQAAPAPEQAAPAAPAPVPTAPPAVATPAPAAAEAAGDPVGGEWIGQARSPDLPPEEGAFKLVLALTPEGKVSGHLTSAHHDGEIDPGSFDRETGRLRFDFQGGEMVLNFDAQITGSAMSGRIEVQGMFSLDFDARRSTEQLPGAAVTAAAAPAAATPASSPPAATPAAAPAAGGGKPIRELVPGPRWVASIAASRFEAGRVYLGIDGHRSNDDDLYAFVSEDFGATWRSIRANLPASAGSVRVLREDITNPDILYLGCEFSAWASIDRGASWTRLNGTLPTVAVHEFAQHPTSNEVVLATHGRSLWILNVSPLRQTKRDSVASAALLFRPPGANYWRDAPERGAGLRRFVGANPSDAASIYFALGRAPQVLELKITDAAGKAIRTLEAPSATGLHRVSWDMRSDRGRAGQAPRGGQGGGQFQGGGRGARGPRVEPGTYYVVLSVDDQEYRQPLSVKGDPEYPDAVLWGEAYDEMLEAMEQHEEEEGGVDDEDVIW